MKKTVKKFRISSVLTKSGLRAYLKRSRSTFQIYSGSNCPVAKYLKNALGTRRVAVGAKTIDVGSHKCLRTPDWAAEFIKRVDAQSTSFISPKTALDLL